MSSQHLKTLTCPPGPCRRPRRSLAERSPRCPPKWRGCLESLARRKAAPEDTERVALYTWITHCESSLKFLSRTKTPTLNLATFSKSSWNTQQQWVIYPFFTTPSSHMQSLFLVIFTAKQWRLIIMWFEKGEEGVWWVIKTIWHAFSSFGGHFICSGLFCVTCFQAESTI